MSGFFFIFCSWAAKSKGVSVHRPCVFLIIHEIWKKQFFQISRIATKATQGLHINWDNLIICSSILSISSTLFRLVECEFFITNTPHLILIQKWDIDSLSFYNILYHKWDIQKTFPVGSINSLLQIKHLNTYYYILLCIWKTKSKIQNHSLIYLSLNSKGKK